MREHRLLFGSLMALLTLGLGAYVSLTVRGGDPPRAFIWLELVWIAALAVVTFGLDWQLRRDTRR